MAIFPIFLQLPAGLNKSLAGWKKCTANVVIRASGKGGVQKSAKPTGWNAVINSSVRFPCFHQSVGWSRQTAAVAAVVSGSKKCANAKPNHTQPCPVCLAFTRPGQK